MNATERDAFYDELVQGVASGELTLGDVVRSLRVEVAGLNQATFARATKVSERTLRQIEKDTGNPTLATGEALVQPFGLQLGLQRRPTSPAVE